MQLKGDSPLVEEFELSLWLAAGRGFWRGTALAMTAQFVAASFTSSPSLWWCSVLLGALFVWWWCSLRRVMYERFFFLYDVAVLLPFISKKKKNVTPLF